jgi:hypothetical protein
MAGEKGQHRKNLTSGSQLTVSKFREKDIIWHTLQDDTSLSVIYIDGLLPGEAVDDDEACGADSKYDHGPLVR